MQIRNNLIANFTTRQIGINALNYAKASHKLSSGYRINRAADDAAGLAISEKLRRSIRGYHQGGHNVQDGISMVQVMDGGMSGISDILQRVNELAIRAGNETLTQEDRSYIQSEITNLTLEVDRMANVTTFNEKRLLNVPPDGFVYGTPPNEWWIVKVQPQVTTYVGYIDVELGDSFWIDAAFGTTTGAVFPDLSLVSPDGAHYGYTWTYGDTGGNWTATPEAGNMSNVADSMSYNGYLVPGNNERWYVNNVRPGGVGRWEIHINHTGGTTESTFVLSSTHGITLVGGASDGGDGAERNGIWIQAGPEVGDGMLVSRYDCRAQALGVGGLNVMSPDSAAMAIERVKGALQTISSYRANNGAMQNRLEHTYNNVKNTEENLTAAESRIRDTDMAEWMVKFANESVLRQVSSTILAQANQIPEGVLALLR